MFKDFWKRVLPKEKEIVWWFYYSLTWTDTTFAYLVTSESKRKPPWEEGEHALSIAGSFETREAAWQAILEYATKRSLRVRRITESKFYEGYMITLDNPKNSLVPGVSEPERWFERQG